MKMILSKEEQYLLALLRQAMGQKESSEKIDQDLEIDVAKVITLARKHAVLSLLYDVVQDNALFQKFLFTVESDSRKTVLQSYRLLFLTKYLVALFQEAEMPVVVLKGVATGNLYDVPELRKSGDVDILLADKVKDQAIIDIMNKAGFRKTEEQHANHHIAFATQEGISIEVHTLLAEPFAYKKINKAMERETEVVKKHFAMEEVMGVTLPVLDKPFHAYELLLHMLQHFMYAGFGLKLLCDWVMMWRKNWSEEEKKLFQEF